MIDDSRDTTSSFAMLLERQGHVVRTLNDARTAVEVVHKFSPDIILLDLAMPNLDGYEVARRIRQEPGFETARIVAISGFADESHKSQAKDAGVDRYLVKPINFDELDGIFSELGPPPP